MRRGEDVDDPILCQNGVRGASRDTLEGREEHAPSRSSEIVGGHGSIWYALVVIWHFWKRKVAFK